VIEIPVEDAISNNEINPMESLESILADLQVKYKSDQSNLDDKSDKRSQDLSEDLPKVQSSSLDQLLADLHNRSSSFPEVVEPNDVQQPQPMVNHTIDYDLQKVADRQKAKDREQITKQATEWLKNLDVLSGEGLWFEEFAKNYSSRLEAAIALIATKIA